MTSQTTSRVIQMEKQENQQQNTNNSFSLPTSKGKNRKQEMKVFAGKILEISKTIGFKLSSRGWCYQLESFRIINKGEFDRVEKLINECRKRGLLPLDFVAEDSKRGFHNIYNHDTDNPLEKIKTEIALVLSLGTLHHVDVWEEEEYFIQILVEKIDLVTLFTPICEKYFIPIANVGGWYDIMVRARLIERFQEKMKQGCKPVILYFGDLDPYGEGISDYLRENLQDLVEATGFDASPENLIIDRFGLDKKFVDDNNLTWIDNLQTGSGKEADINNPIVKKYVDKYGKRKVEANAIVVIPQIARNLCETTILKYLGKDFLERVAKKKEVIKKEYLRIMEKSKIRKPLEEALKVLEGLNYEEIRGELKKEEDMKERIGEEVKDIKKVALELETTILHEELAVMCYSSLRGIEIGNGKWINHVMGELVDRKTKKIIGYAKEDNRKLYNKKGEEIGYFKMNGECYLFSSQSLFVS